MFSLREKLLTPSRVRRYVACATGCSSARRERLLWEQEVGGSNPLTPNAIAPVAQWIEQRPSKPWVEGSIPSWRGCASLNDRFVRREA